MDNLQKVCKILRDNEYSAKIDELEELKKKKRLLIIYESEDELEELKNKFLNKLNPTKHESLIPFHFEINKGFSKELREELMELTKKQNEHWVDSTTSLICNMYLGMGVYSVTRVPIEEYTEDEVYDNRFSMSLSLFCFIRDILFKEVYDVVDKGMTHVNFEACGLIYDYCCFKCKSCKKLYTKCYRNEETFNVEYCGEKNTCVVCCDGHLFNLPFIERSS